MATRETLFGAAGITSENGVYKVRTAQDVDRVKVWAKEGKENIRLVALPEQMTKIEAVKFLLNHPDFQDEIGQNAVADYLAKTAPKAPKVAKVKEVKVVAVKTEKAPKKAKKSTGEDAALAEARAVARELGLLETVGADIVDNDDDDLPY